MCIPKWIFIFAVVIGGASRSEPLDAQSSRTVPLPPSAAGIMQSNCDLRAGITTLRGSMPAELQSDQPVSIAILPETPLSLAYVRSVAVAFAPNGSDPKMIAHAHSEQAINDAMAIAMHQSDLMSLMHMTRPDGATFSCAHLSAGKFIVLVTTARAYRTNSKMSGYVSSSNKFEFYAAEAVVNSGQRIARPGRFYRLGESVSAS